MHHSMIHVPLVLPVVLLLIILNRDFLSFVHVVGCCPPSSLPFRAVTRALVSGTSIISASGLAQTLFVEIDVGSPPVRLNVQIDTGSSTFWIASALCTAGNGCPPSKVTNSYNPNKSSSLRNSTQINLERQYGDGTRIRCTVVTDLLVIAGIKIPKQNICAATFIEFANSLGQDGLIGIGPPQQTDPADVFVMLRTVTTESKISFYYDQSVDTLEETSLVANSGEITFGTPNPARYSGEFTWLPIITTDSRWAVTLDSITTSTSTQNIAKGILLDTGTTLIYLDSELFPLVNTAMGGIPKQGGIYELDCSVVRMLPPITFVLGGVGASFTLTWDMQFFRLKKTRCISIFTMSPSQSNVFGVIFLRHFYTSFDSTTGRIGLAQPTGLIKTERSIMPTITRGISQPTVKSGSVLMATFHGWCRVCIIALFLIAI